VATLLPDEPRPIPSTEGDTVGTDPELRHLRRRVEYDLILTILSSSAGMIQSAPGGLGYLSEVFQAGNLRDRLTQEQLQDGWLFGSVNKLQRRYPKRIKARWVDPHSPMGLYLAVRFRIRSFPAIIVGRRTFDPGSDPGDFERLITDLLSNPES